MPDLPTTTASYLFATSALLNAISVPGHIVFGWKNLDPTLHTLTSPSATYTQSLAATCASVGWDHMTVGLIAAAALNWRWASTTSVKGPQGMAEKVILVSLLAGGLLVGRRPFALGQYRPLICLWVAPVLSLVGWGLVW